MAAEPGKLTQRLRRLPWWRFAAGLVGGVSALIVTFLLRIMGLGVFLPEQALSLVVTHIPGSLESTFIDALGEGAKLLGLASAAAAVLAAYGVGAILFRRVQARVRNRYAVMGIYALGSSVLVLVVALPILGAGLAGSLTDAGVAWATVSQLLGGWVYAAVLDYFLVDYASRYPQGFQASRRQLLVGGAAAVALFAAGLYGLASTVGQTARLAFATVDDLLRNAITPTDAFYTVTKNFVDPTVDKGTWSLAVGGLVQTPKKYSYQDVHDLMDRSSPAAEQYTTMECVSNEVGGNLIGTAKWRGVRLMDLLNAAGVGTAAAWVAFTCADGYVAAIPLELAMRPTTLLVLEMNGLPLEDRHGFPARILVPGKYGMFSAKWVTEITVARDETQGFWQAKGWTDVGYDKTTAFITTPMADGVIGGPVTLGGFAYAGTRGISKVEVSTDGGSTWSTANLQTPSPLDPALTWVVWTFPWTPPGNGAYRILARAYEADGTPQTAAIVPPFPDGASGYDQITLYVSE